MSHSDAHDEWFCCRPYLISTTSSSLPMPQETRQFLTAGISGHVIKQFLDYPTFHPTPSTVIEVQRDYWGREHLPKITLYFYFALDHASGLWYELGTDRWMEMRSGMSLDSHVKTYCRSHGAVHSFQTYKSHATMEAFYPGREFISR